MPPNQTPEQIAEGLNLTPEERDRFIGYLDGGDPDCPEPSMNRSASYRHGFAVARADRAGKPAFGNAAIARKKADEAEQHDLSVRRALEKMENQPHD